MATQYPNSGKLSDNRYKDNPKKPDMVGEIVMQRSALKELLGEHDGDDIVIKLSSWKMEGNYGPWLRLSWNNYKPKTEIASPPKQAAQPVDDQDIPF